MRIVTIKSAEEIDKAVSELFRMRNQNQKRAYAKRLLKKAFEKTPGTVMVLVDDGSPDEGWLFPPSGESHGGYYGGGHG